MRTFEPADAQVASNRTPRRINSRAVLGIIRRQQPLSRADLARISGLRPSTISLIVDELIANGWVLEGKIADSLRGRRPTMLALNPQRCVVALDLHPSQITIAMVDISGRIVSQNEVNLPSNPETAIATMAAAVRKIIQKPKGFLFEGIGICVPGRTDIGARQLVFAPNLKWPAVALKAKIEEATGLPVVMDNVANACALSEVWFGDTNGSTHDFVVVAISEGIGTGVFINGRVARGRGGMAGEFGHVQMKENGVPCNCGERGCWETLASNRAAVRIFQEMCGRKKPIAFSAILRLADAGDATARETLSLVAKEVARGLRMIATALAPFEIIVVGEITRAWHVVGPIVEEAVRQNRIANPVRIRPSYDSSTARLRSAAALVLASHPLAGSLSQ